MFPCISEKQLLREERQRLGTDLAWILGGEEGRKGGQGAWQGPRHLRLGCPQPSLCECRVWIPELLTDDQEHGSW